MNRKIKIERVLLIVSLIMVLLCLPVYAASGKKENSNQNSYRVIKIYQMDGTVTIQDKDGKNKSVYNGMNLSSGDTAVTGKDSHLYLQLDNDKYLMAEPNTKFTIEASGTAKDSKTSITIVTGALINRVDQKLNKNSSYEVTTPNATMAIRGTVMGVKVIISPDKLIDTEVDLHEGNLEVRSADGKGLQLKNANNSTKDNATIIMTAGESINLNTGKSGETEAVAGKINYSLESAESLQFLIDSTTTGRQLTISIEELKKLEEKKKAEEQSKGNQSSNNSQSGSGTIDKSDWKTDEEPESRGTAESLPD